jgi:hypothetical protein
MFISFSLKLVNLLNNIVGLFHLVSIKVLSSLFLFILMCGALYKWVLYMVIKGLSVLLMIFSYHLGLLLKDKSDVFSVFQMLYKII